MASTIPKLPPATPNPPKSEHSKAPLPTISIRIRRSSMNRHAAALLASQSPSPTLVCFYYLVTMIINVLSRLFLYSLLRATQLYRDCNPCCECSRCPTFEDSTCRSCWKYRKGWYIDALATLIHACLTYAAPVVATALFLVAVVGESSSFSNEYGRPPIDTAWNCESRCEGPQESDSPLVCDVSLETAKNGSLVFGNSTCPACSTSMSWLNCSSQCLQNDLSRDLKMRVYTVEELLAFGVSSFLMVMYTLAALFQLLMFLCFACGLCRSWEYVPKHTLIEEPEVGSLKEVSDEFSSSSSSGLFGDSVCYAHRFYGIDTTAIRWSRDPCHYRKADNHYNEFPTHFLKRIRGLGSFCSTYDLGVAANRVRRAIGNVAAVFLFGVSLTPSSDLGHIEFSSRAHMVCFVVFLCLSLDTLFYEILTTYISSGRTESFKTWLRRVRQLVSEVPFQPRPTRARPVEYNGIPQPVPANCNGGNVRLDKFDWEDAQDYLGVLITSGLGLLLLLVGGLFVGLFATVFLSGLAIHYLL